MRPTYTYLFCLDWWIPHMASSFQLCGMRHADSSLYDFVVSFSIPEKAALLHLHFFCTICDADLFPILLYISFPLSRKTLHLLIVISSVVRLQRIVHCTTTVVPWQRPNVTSASRAGWQNAAGIIVPSWYNHTSCQSIKGSHLIIHRLNLTQCSQ